MNDLVSVIITTYKGSDHIERAIKSVQNQSYKNIEIIVVDDNGKGTAEQVRTETIIKEKIQGKITYYPHDKNKNGSAARNTGIALSNGTYIALLDDDDAFRENKIELQVKRLEETKAQVCYTSMCIHYPDGHTGNAIQNLEGNIFRQVMLRKIQAPSSVLMFRKDSAEKIGGFDVTFRRHQDWEFLDRISMENTICVVQAVCMDRFIEKRNSAANATAFEKNRLYYLSKMKKYIEKLSAADQKALYFKHYSDIAKEFLKEMNIKKAFIYACKTENLPAFLKLMVKSFIKRC